MIKPNHARWKTSTPGTMPSSPWAWGVQSLLRRAVTGKQSLAHATRALLPLMVCLILAACGEAPSSQQASAAAAQAGPTTYPYRITTTTGMITDIVRQVAGDLGDLHGIMKEGVDPHLYQPTRADVANLSQAQIIFYNGLLLEGKMTDILVQLARTKPVHPVTEDLFESGEYVMNTPDDHYDPHVWMDVKGWMAAVKAVQRRLAEFDPKNASVYESNAQTYLAELEKLDDYARRVIASIPRDQRVLVTAHDAFNYLGRAYDLEVRGIQGISTESEAGVKDINNLIDFLVERKIGAVFVETSVADKNVRALIEGARSRGHAVRIGGTLFSDAMGPGGTYEGTYIGMIDHNVTTIAGALGGEAPDTGLNGRLSGVSH